MVHKVTKKQLPTPFLHQH